MADDLHSQPGTGIGGLVSLLAVVGFSDVVWDSYCLSFAIDQYLASWQILDGFPYLLIGFVSVPTNRIQVFHLLHFSMSSALNDLMIDNLVHDEFFCLVIFLVFDNSSFFVWTQLSGQALSTSVAVTSEAFSFFCLVASSWSHSFSSSSLSQRYM